MASNRPPKAKTGPRKHGRDLTSDSHWRTRRAVPFLFLLLLPLRADGQSEPPSPSAGEEAIVFQEIPFVYGASKYEQKVTEAPSSVTLVTADEIKKSGHRTLADVLRSVNGFFVTYDRDYSYLGIRGFNRPGDFNSRVLLLVDGHRLNDNIYDQAGIGTESLIDVDLIDRVEIIRGPSSSLYGTNAFFGVINVITKRGRDVQGSELSGEAGSYDSYKGRATYGNKLQNGVEILVSSSYYDSAGHNRLFFKEFNDPTTNNGVTKRGDDDQFPSAFSKLSYRDFTLQGGFVSREKGIPTASYGTVFNTTRTRSLDEHGYVNLKFERQFSDQQLGVMGRAYYDRFYYQGDYLYDSTTDPFVVLNRDKIVGEWWGGEIKLDKRLLEKHLVTAGAEYRDNFRQELRNEDTHPPFSYLNVKKSSENWAVFLQDEFSILDNLLLNGGVRYDHYDSFGGTINPRLALIYNLEKTTIKALYGEAFRAPNAYEQFYIGTGFKASDDLDPETIRTYELVLERYLGDRLRASAAGYYYRINSLISQQTDPAEGLLVFRNAGDIEAMGAEVGLELEGQWPLGLDGRLGYAVQQAEDRKTGKRLTNSPQHMVKFNLSVPVFRQYLFASLDVHYLSARETLARHSTGGYATTNVTLLSQNLLKGVELSGSVYNLFDENYGDPGSGEHRQDIIEQDGRTFWLKLKYSF